MNNRKRVNMETKLAAALLALGHINYEHAKLMTASQICSLFHWDHYPMRVADGGENVPWNLTPRFIGEHRAKTAKVDHPQIAKQRRIRKKQENHKEALKIKSGEPLGRIKIVSRLTSRPFPKGRKFASRG